MQHRDRLSWLLRVGQAKAESEARTNREEISFSSSNLRGESRKRNWANRSAVARFPRRRRCVGRAGMANGCDVRRLASIPFRPKRFLRDRRDPCARISPLGAHDKTLSPELDAIAAGWRFMADAIYRRDKAAIRDRMTALHRFPGGMLRGAIFLLSRAGASRSRSDKREFLRRATRLSAPLPDTTGPSKRRRRDSRARFAKL